MNPSTAFSTAYNKTDLKQACIRGRPLFSILLFNKYICHTLVQSPILTGFSCALLKLWKSGLCCCYKLNTSSLLYTFQIKSSVFFSMDPLFLKKAFIVKHTQERVWKTH